MQILTDILSVFVFYRSTFHTSRFKLIYIALKLRH